MYLRARFVFFKGSGSFLRGPKFTDSNVIYSYHGLTYLKSYTAFDEHSEGERRVSFPSDYTV